MKIYDWLETDAWIFILIPTVAVTFICYVCNMPYYFTVGVFIAMFIVTHMDDKYGS